MAMREKVLILEGFGNPTPRSIARSIVVTSLMNSATVVGSLCIIAANYCFFTHQ